ncbi:hypothetical protein R1flu_009600 [Riccia fluitans]|uniref:Phytocyanin domain-containing protein n=1 Tax=Riccia fluitans TaxID=41844 RepID=A0ABD1Z2K4_9MARC
MRGGSAIAGFIVVGILAVFSVGPQDEDFQVARGDKSWAVPNSVNGLDYETWAETDQYHVGEFLTELLLE